MCSLTNWHFSRRITPIQGEQRSIQFQRWREFIFVIVDALDSAEEGEEGNVIPLKDEAKRSGPCEHRITSDRSDH